MNNCKHCKMKDRKFETFRDFATRMAVGYSVGGGSEAERIKKAFKGYRYAKEGRLKCNYHYNYPSKHHNYNYDYEYIKFRKKYYCDSRCVITFYNISLKEWEKNWIHEYKNKKYYG